MNVTFWFLLEALAAAGLLALFVWWTWPRKRKDGDADKNEDPKQ